MEGRKKYGTRREICREERNMEGGETYVGKREIWKKAEKCGR